MTDDQASSSASDASASQDEVQVLRLRIKELEQQLAEMQRFKDLAARAQADLQNAKTRIERESGELRKFATEQLIVRILPTLDSFQRAFQQVPAELQSQEWVKGVSAIEQDLMRQMADAGLVRMQSMGVVADPARHEVITVGPGEEGKVTEVFDEGYELHGKVLRPAKVRVGDGSKAA
jgi:molecular chaperone GrpE